jgi:tRNA pseudouridine55 synthase
MNRIFILNKPLEFTSQDAVSKLKKILNQKKAGHTGTLDPMATGVLPILVGETTKLSKYLVEHKKTYIAVLKLGTCTDTGDSEGKIIEEKKVDIENLTKDKVEFVLNEFLGKQIQTPPIYSAIKINGKKLYEYARNGMEVEIPKREIEIYNIKLIKLDKNEKEIEFEVECSKGTYIRTLCEDIAKKLDTIGYMKSLTRTKVNNFKLEDTITFEDLENNKNNEEWLLHNSYTMEEIFDYLPKLELNDRKKELFLNGVQLTFKEKDGLYNIYNNKNYLGTGTIKNELLKRDIIILQN